MDDMNVFERQLAEESLRIVGPDPVVDDVAIFAAITATQSRKWRFPSVFSAAKSITAGAIVALISGLLLVAQPFGRVVVTVPGAETEGLPPVTGPAGNGLIAFEREGDIYLGDPVTGESGAIVAGPELETSPRFSPDGTLIAFRRVHAPDEALEAVVGNADADWVVVRADGSDERVLAPTDGPFGRGAGDFVWSPDGGSLVVTQATDGGPTFSFYLLDATGSGDAVPIGSLTSPKPGFRASQVASFLRPPLGDRLLVSECCDDPDAMLLAVTDLDGSDASDLGERSGLEGMGYRRLAQAEWSPDGSHVLVSADLEIHPASYHLYVMGADGSDVRRLGESEDYRLGLGTWSPDGSSIAAERGMAVGPGSSDEVIAWITIIDVESGALRDLEATRFTSYDGQGIWDLSWLPDGRSILMMRGEPGTRPLIIDVEADTATELPWESDSIPSWQRVAAD